MTTDQEKRLSAVETKLTELESWTPRRTLQRFVIGSQIVCEVHPDQWGAFDEARGSIDGPYVLGTLQQAVTAAFETELALRPAARVKR